MNLLSPIAIYSCRWLHDAPWASIERKASFIYSRLCNCIGIRKNPLRGCGYGFIRSLPCYVLQNTSLSHVGRKVSNLCYVGKHIFDQCFDTSSSATTSVTWAGMSLISASALLLMLRHFCYVGRHVSIQYCTVPSGTYCVVSLSFIVIDLCRQTLICCIQA